MTNDDGRKPEGAPERSLKAGVPSGVDGNGPKRFSVQRKMAIVARLLRGVSLELVARETNVSIARLTEWRERALAGAATALKERDRDDRDDEIARLKSKVGEITMDNELLYAKIEALEGKLDLPRFRGEVRSWDQGTWFDCIVSSSLGQSFGSAESIFSSWPMPRPSCRVAVKDSRRADFDENVVRPIIGVAHYRFK